MELGAIGEANEEQGREDTGGKLEAEEGEDNRARGIRKGNREERATTMSRRRSKRRRNNFFQQDRTKFTNEPGPRTVLWVYVAVPRHLRIIPTAAEC